MNEPTQEYLDLTQTLIEQICRLDDLGKHLATLMREQEFLKQQILLNAQAARQASGLSLMPSRN